MAAKKVPDWVPLAAIGVVAVLVLFKSSSTAASSGTSIANATNSPIYPVTSNGSQVNQLLPQGQVTPNEPGTAPIITSGGVSQYG